MDTTTPPTPPTTEGCRLIGAGDGSVMVYCRPCREPLPHRAFRGTLASAVEAWADHLATHHTR